MAQHSMNLPEARFYKRFYNSPTFRVMATSHPYKQLTTSDLHHKYSTLRHFFNIFSGQNPALLRKITPDIYEMADIKAIESTVRVRKRLELSGLSANTDLVRRSKNVQKKLKKTVDSQRNF
jgi:hypothetical protein